MSVCQKIWYCYSFLVGFKCTFQLYSSGFFMLWYGYKYHVTLCIGQLHPITVSRTVLFWCEYWIGHVTFGLLYFVLRVSIRIFNSGVPGFVTDCPWGVWCNGLTTFLLYVGPLFINLVWNDTRFVSLILWRTAFSLFLIIYTYIYIYLYVYKYIYLGVSVLFL